LATLKLTPIEDRTAGLERIASAIRQLVQRCDKDERGGCPIVASLSLDVAGNEDVAPPQA
jgi:hypothetical protein